jgi:hypothetical protein
VFREGHESSNLSERTIRRKEAADVNECLEVMSPPQAGKHGSDEARRIAEAGTILRCLVGSGVHGLAVGDQDDRDEMGICVEPPEYVIGLRRIQAPGQGSVRFEQYEHHTAWERPGGLANRSGPGDLDYVCYSLRKWMRLALGGNPSVLLPLFVPDENIVAVTDVGRELRALAPAIISRQAGERFAGYLEAQRRSLLSREGKGRDVTRPELVARYGWDTKYGCHMVRLGVQGVELLKTGRITLPVPEPWRSAIRELRVGGRSMEWALAVAADLEARIAALAETSPLREHPDEDEAGRWLTSVYLRSRPWKAARGRWWS